ncbi:hypothetical protein C4577_00065 [Candidatus Parcubacteria bacterium]|nr:MAG: hypothetical protein C4577_00065 [Candidatus Parcubacteria bacterium]
MKILLIDNGSKHISKLKDLLKTYLVSTIPCNQVKIQDAIESNVIIFSGGSTNSVVGNDNLYKNEINIIKNINKPMLGICLGLELMTYAFGAKLEKLEAKKQEISQIKIIKKDKIVQGIENIYAYESHKWVVKKLPQDFIGIAKSNDGYEIIKHKNKYLYGCQFHPEIINKKTNGHLILNNFLANI